MRNAGLEETQTGIKIAGRNINNLRYSDDTTLMALTALISHPSKVTLKILQARLQQYVNLELPMFKLVSEQAEKPEIKLATSTGSSKKQESSRKTSILALLTIPKPLAIWITTNCGKF